MPCRYFTPALSSFHREYIPEKQSDKPSISYTLSVVLHTCSHHGTGGGSCRVTICVCLIALNDIDGKMAFHRVVTQVDNLVHLC